PAIRERHLGGLRILCLDVGTAACILGFGIDPRPAWAWPGARRSDQGLYLSERELSDLRVCASGIRLRGWPRGKIATGSGIACRCGALLGQQLLCRDQPHRPAGGAGVAASTGLARVPLERPCRRCLAGRHCWRHDLVLVALHARSIDDDRYGVAGLSRERCAELDRSAPRVSAEVANLRRDGA